MDNEAAGAEPVQEFFSRLSSYGDRPALFWRGRTLTYAELLKNSEEWQPRLAAWQVGQGTVVGFLGDFWPDVVGFMLALIRVGAVAVPFSEGSEREIPKLAALAEVEVLARFGRDAEIAVSHLGPARVHPLVEEFRRRAHPGLIVFTSGSTGEPKGILHDFASLLTKFEKPRPAYRTVLFLLLDHLGGVNTLLSALANGGMGVTAERRSPDAVCRAIEEARADLLPTTPAFLTMLVTSNVVATSDLSSLRVVTYGTDTMPDQTLKATAAAFPGVRLQQTYGLSEVGVLRSKSKESDSLLVRVGGDGFETKVVDHVLWVRSQSAMVGYLNAPNPFDADGWLNTGDLVEEEGDHLRSLGRESDLINVGGQKVFPSEVESVLLQADNVVDATVFAESHPVMGRVVGARVTTATPEDPLELRKRLRKFCLERLAPFKVPARIAATTVSQHNERFKKVRR
jgi:acyl-coenzyme A synthetase/AMP-(fatty) acid ligase